MKNLNKFMLLALSMLIMSCGEKKEKKEKFTIGDEDTYSTSSSSPSEKTSEEDTQVKEVMLTGNDQMQFNLHEIKVKEGQTVKLTLKHIGTMSKDVMGHNFVLLKQGTDIPEFAQAAMKAGEDKDFIPENTDQVIAHTKLLGGGESTSIEFQAPKKGTYDYICSFPGHYSLMHGKLIVE